MIKQLAAYSKKYLLYALLAPLTVIGEVLCELRIPLLMADMVDVGIANGDISYVLKKGGVMILFALLALLCGIVSVRLAVVASMGFGAELRSALFSKVQNFAFSNIDRFSTASLITRLTTDVNTIQNTFMMVIRMCVRAPVMLVCAVILAVKLNAQLATVFLVAGPILAVLLGIIVKTAFPRFQAMLKKFDKINSTVQENLIAIRVVKAFVRAKHEKEKFKIANDELRDASIAAEKIIIWNGPIMMVAMYSCIIAIMWFGGRMIVGGTMQVGVLMTFLTYVNQILMSLMMISMIFVMMVMSKASATRITEVLNDKVDIEDGENAIEDVCDGSVEFKNVSFKYNENAEKNVLSDINISIKAGETIGVIGGTGSAKSTLVQLIPRLYDVTEGQVLVGGRDVREYSLTALRNAVSMVLQKNVLFSGTISENLRWGNPNATDEQIKAACIAAQAHDFVMSFPDGYETDLGQGGVNVSGGQKQRLCIARALLKNPKILILDDSTSAVDTATDAKIRESLKQHSPDTTVIIIAQRINSVSEADRIIVLDDGKIDDIGTNDELLERNEIYRDVYNSQQKGAIA